MVEVIVTGVPAGLGEPMFVKLDAELGRMLGIGAVKGVEVGAGFAVKDMTGYQDNDQMRAEDGKVVFDSNNAGGITGGLTTGQPIVVRLAVKPTPTIAKPQHTIDKYTLENKDLAAITRRDPTIVARIWPVAEAYTALVILDHLMMHYGYQSSAQQDRGKPIGHRGPIGPMGPTASAKLSPGPNPGLSPHICRLKPRTRRYGPLAAANEGSLT